LIEHFAPKRSEPRARRGPKYQRTENRNALSYLVKPLTDSVSRTFRE
jgi:hypothetical protein